MASKRVEEKLSELHQRGLAKPEPAVPVPFVRADAKPRIKSGKPGHVDLYPPLPPHEPFIYNLNLHPGGGYDFPGAAIGKGGSIVREIRQRTGTWLVVCDEQGPLDGRRPPADADVYVRISAHDSSDMGLEAVRAAASRVAELWAPTNAGFKPFTLKFGDAIRLQPDYDLLQGDVPEEYLPPPSNHSNSSSVKPPPPPPPKQQQQSPPSSQAAKLPAQSAGMPSAWGQAPPQNHPRAATGLESVTGGHLSDSPFLLHHHQQQPQQNQPGQMDRSSAAATAWDPWKQQGTQDGNQQASAIAGGGLGQFSLWDSLGADDPLSGLGGTSGLGMDSLLPTSKPVASPWSAAIGTGTSSGTWGPPGAVGVGSWASLASNVTNDERINMPSQQLNHNDQIQKSLAPPGWPGSNMNQAAPGQAIMNNNGHVAAGMVDTNSGTLKSEDSADVEVQDLLSLLTCK